VPMASAQSRLRAVAGHMRCSPAAEQSADGPLKGVVVVEWTTAVQGPAAGQYLSDMGASVIKIEGPVGDGNRHGRGTQNETVSSRLRDIAAALFFWVVAAVADGAFVVARVCVHCRAKLAGNHQPRAGLEPQFVSVNMGKRSLSIDMKDPASFAVVLKLLEDADVFVRQPPPSHRHLPPPMMPHRHYRIVRVRMRAAGQLYAASARLSRPGL
jgi:hypothetical protein